MVHCGSTEAGQPASAARGDETLAVLAEHARGREARPRHVPCARCSCTTNGVASDVKSSFYCATTVRQGEFRQPSTLHARARQA